MQARGAAGLAVWVEQISLRRFSLDALGAEGYAAVCCVAGGAGLFAAACSLLISRVADLADPRINSQRLGVHVTCTLPLLGEK